MKKMNSILIFLMIWGSFISCDKTMPKPNPCKLNPCDTTTLLGKLDTLWTTPVKDQNNRFILQHIFYSNDKIKVVGTANSQGFIYAFDPITSAKLWENDYTSIYNFPAAGLHLSSNLIVVQNRRDIVALNFITGFEFKHYYQPTGLTANPDGYILGDHYYYVKSDNGYPYAQLLRTHISDFNQWEEVYLLTKAESGTDRPNIDSYNLWIHPHSGDSILIIQHRMALPNRVDVLAWNMRTKEVVWRHDDITKHGNSNHQQIIIHDNKAYFSGGAAFYCFDMFDGEIVWQYNHPSGLVGFLYLKPLILEQENLVIVKDAGNLLLAFDLKNGAIKWQTTESGNYTLGSGSPSYHNGIIYFTNRNLLWAVRASNGDILWSERSDKPLYKTTFNGDVAIDPERKLLYATDETRLFAIKLYGE
jgi:outer membrane protein assembly factor BamB